MINLLAVAGGGAIGALLRYALTSVFSLAAFPLGTLLVNVIGSFAIGTLAGLWLLNGEPATPQRLFFQTGLLGAFTTFSAFSLDTMTLWQNGQSVGAVVNIVLNVGLCLISVVAGLGVVTAWQQ
jgi:CrcB protein